MFQLFAVNFFKKGCFQSLNGAFGQQVSAYQFFFGSYVFIRTVTQDYNLYHRKRAFKVSVTE
jgi:hypothetical protein